MARRKKHAQDEEEQPVRFCACKRYAQFADGSWRRWYWGHGKACYMKLGPKPRPCVGCKQVFDGADNHPETPKDKAVA